MWILKNIKGESVFYVKAKQEYVIGRNTGDLVFPNDKSVSRKHASLYANNNNVSVEDHNSKYGTYIDEGIDSQQKIDPAVRVVLRDGSRIMFGLLGNEWLLSHCVYKTCMSTIKEADLATVKSVMDELGVIISKEWTNECTHLTMPTITLTLKVVLALVQNKPIVKPEFWTECLKCYNSNLPFPSSRSFLPDVNESSISQQANFHADERRISLFAEKLFIFMSRQQMKNYEDVISSAGGRSRYLGSGTVTRGELSATHSIVIQPSPGYKSSQATQNSQEKIDNIVKQLTSKKKRTIPELEIGLAILHVSMEKYCNPSFNFASVIIQDKVEEVTEQRKVLAPETQETIASTVPSLSGNVKYIDETLNSSIAKANTSASSSISCEEQPTASTSVSPPKSDITLKKRNKQTDLNQSSIHSNEDDLFCFVQDDKKPPVSQIKSNKLELTLQSVKRKRQDDVCNDDDLFNFVPGNDKAAKTPKLDSLADKNISTDKPIINSLNLGKSIKRKLNDLDIPDGKKRNTTTTPSTPAKVTDLSNTVKYSCQKRFTTVKDDPDAVTLELSSKLKELDILPAIVVVCNDLIVKKENNISRDITNVNVTKDGKKNFKKFIKVRPRRSCNNIVSSSMLVEYHQKMDKTIPQQFLADSSGEEDEDNFKSFSRFNKQVTKGRSRRL